MAPGDITSEGRAGTPKEGPDMRDILADIRQVADVAADRVVAENPNIADLDPDLLADVFLAYAADVTDRQRRIGIEMATRDHWRHAMAERVWRRIRESR